MAQRRVAAVVSDPVINRSLKTESICSTSKVELSSGSADRFLISFA